MKIHAVTTQSQYRRHVMAVWRHIDSSLQGQTIHGRLAQNDRRLRALPPDDIVMVGGYYDVMLVRNRMVYVEHGAGQAYNGDPVSANHPSYHGGKHPPRVIGYVCPNERVAESWGRPAIAAGAPALDDIERRTIRHVADKVAAMTFHFEARGAFVAPEAWSAREHYLDMLHNMVAELRSRSFEVLGTWHPRDPLGQRIWKNMQVESTPDPDEVLNRAHLLIADNTSLMYEAAYLGIPVIALNAPWYRRDVEHGLRFWDHVPGKTVDSAEEFMSLGVRAYSNDCLSFLTAQSAGAYAFGEPRNDAGEQAARWVEKLALGEV